MLGYEPDADRPAEGRGLIDRDFLWLSAFMAAAILLRYRPNPWLRRLFLLAAAAILGWWLNLQFSTQHVFTLLGGQPPHWILDGACFMVFAVPVLTLLFGNVYCGYVCPFGALQELVGEVWPQPQPGKNAWRYARQLKYLLLFLLVILFACFRDYGVLSADPLTTLFSALRSREVLLLGVVVLVLAVPYRRFWCRNLCPAGAFLALLNKVQLLRRVTPRPRPTHCDLGVRNLDELDCIRCDRCRHE